MAVARVVNGSADPGTGCCTVTSLPNGDGTDDLLWQHNDGTVHYWKILNGQRQGGINIGGTGPVGPEWRLIGAGNLNGN